MQIILSVLSGDEIHSADWKLQEEFPEQQITKAESVRGTNQIQAIIFTGT